MADNIAVIIPYYQRKSGILSRAVLSALLQECVSPIIYVVDDASPVPASVELAELIQAYPGRIVIVEQANGGPAAARNKGLDRLPVDTGYVAFLDSDDIWTSNHLSNATFALSRGFDFYFSDLFQLNQTVSAFARAKRISVADHHLISGSDHVREYAGDMKDQIIMGNIIGTPTVAYNFSKFPDLRFREEFVYAGEDYLFWLELANKTKKIAFSDLCECTCGEGVNVFAGSGWGTEKSLIRLHYEMKYKKALIELHDLDQRQKNNVNGSIKILRKSFVLDLLHRIIHRKLIEKKVLLDQFRTDPQSFLFFIPIAISMMFHR